MIAAALSCGNNRKGVRARNDQRVFAELEPGVSLGNGCRERRAGQLFPRTADGLAWGINDHSINVHFWVSVSLSL